MSMEIKHPGEWFLQADYDLETADAMFKSKRYIYTVFMCHLSIEKALKGFYVKKFQEVPPKIHNLIYLIEKVSLQMTDDLYDFIFSLNRVSVPTRYPDDLKRILKDYDEDKIKDILIKTGEVLKCLKKML
ncbi:MAG: HEPN domain-containing protein [Candidatus Firestonebacteria bacterium]